MTLINESFVERWEKYTLPWLTGLALLSLVQFIVSATARNPSPGWSYLNYGIWGLFAADFLLRIVRTDDRKEFLKRNPLDALSLLTPQLRILRVLTVVGRLFAISSRGTSYRLITSSGLVVLMSVLALAAAVLQAERDAPGASITTLPDALWWAMTTVSTVGYGDLVPVTALGRLYASFLMVIGIGALGTVTAALASRLVGEQHGDGGTGTGTDGAADESTRKDGEDGKEGRDGKEGQGREGGARAADPVDQLRRLAELRRAGLVTDEEFRKAKRRLLSRL